MRPARVGPGRIESTMNSRRRRSGCSPLRASRRRTPHPRPRGTRPAGWPRYDLASVEKLDGDEAKLGVPDVLEVVDHDVVGTRLLVLGFSTPVLPHPQGTVVRAL